MTEQILKQEVMIDGQQVLRPTRRASPRWTP